MTSTQGWFDRSFGAQRRQFEAWQRRRYWAHVALNAHHGEGSNGTAVCDGLEALELLGYSEHLFDLCQQLDGLPGITPAEHARHMRLRLVRELYAPAAASLLGTPEGRLGGYAWARAAALAPTLRNLRLRAGLSQVEPTLWSRLEERLAGIVGSGSVLGIYAIGLAAPWRRGFAPLKQLLRPLLDLGVRNDAAHALWWIPAASSLHAVSLGFGANVVAEAGAGSVFHHPDVPTLARVFAGVPASTIADGLARQAPARPAATPALRMVSPLPKPQAVPRQRAAP